jgi:hypothetical protein
MIDTIKIRRLLIKASKTPNAKNVEKLTDLVLDLCDAYDKQPNVLEVIDKNQASLDNTFNFIKSIRG